MVDGFHWTRVTSKQLRFLYEDITTLPPPPKMKELAEAIDRGLAAASGATASQPIRRYPECGAGLSKNIRHIEHLAQYPDSRSQSARVRQLAWQMVQCGTSAALLNVCCMNVKEYSR